MPLATAGASIAWAVFPHRVKLHSSVRWLAFPAPRTNSFGLKLVRALLKWAIGQLAPVVCATIDDDSSNRRKLSATTAFRWEGTVVLACGIAPPDVSVGARRVFDGQPYWPMPVGSIMLRFRPAE